MVENMTAAEKKKHEAKVLKAKKMAEKMLKLMKIQKKIVKGARYFTYSVFVIAIAPAMIQVRHAAVGLLPPGDSCA